MDGSVTGSCDVQPGLQSSEGQAGAGESASGMAHWQAGTGSWQKVLCPCCVGLSTGLSTVHNL